LSLGSRSGKWISGEWNECPVRGCGAWWPYKSERVGLGRFGLVGYREGSGWGREAVERVQGGPGVMPCLGSSCCGF
jgi:hypothetical protein